MMIKEGDALAGVQPGHLVRLHQVPGGVALGLGIGAHIGVERGEQRRQRHLGVHHLDGDLAALLRDVLGGGQVVAAHVEGLVKGGQLVLPLLAGVLFLPLGQALDHHLAGHIEAPDGVEGVGHSLHVPDVAILIQAEIDQHRESALYAVEPGVVGELRNGQGEEQGAEEAVGTVLGGDDHEVGTGLLAGEGQVHIVVPGDSVHQAILEHGKPVAKANDDIPP